MPSISGLLSSDEESIRRSYDSVDLFLQPIVKKQLNDYLKNKGQSLLTKRLRTTVGSRETNLQLANVLKLTTILICTMLIYFDIYNSNKYDDIQRYSLYELIVRCHPPVILKISAAFLFIFDMLDLALSRFVRELAAWPFTLDCYWKPWSCQCAGLSEWPSRATYCRMVLKSMIFSEVFVYWGLLYVMMLLITVLVLNFWYFVYAFLFTDGIMNKDRNLFLETKGCMIYFLRIDIRFTRL